MIDPLVVVGGQSRARSLVEQALRQPVERRVHVALVLESERSGLLVRPFDESHTRALRDQPLDIRLAAPEHRLDDDADILEAPPHLVEQFQRELRVARTLHVDTHPVVGIPRRFED